MKTPFLFDYKFSKMASLVLSLDRFDLSQDGIVHKYLPDFLLEHLNTEKDKL